MLFTILITFWFWSWFVTFCALSGILALLSIPCRGLKNKQTHDRITYILEKVLCKSLLYLMSWVWAFKIVYGSEQAKESLIREDDTDKTKSQKIIRVHCNQSSIIGPLFISQLPFRKTYTYRNSMLWIPVLGKLIEHAKYIKLDKLGEKSKKLEKALQKRLKLRYYPVVWNDDIATDGEANDNQIHVVLLGCSRGFWRGLVSQSKIMCVICEASDVEKFLLKETKQGKDHNALKRGEIEYESEEEDEWSSEDQ